MVSKYQAAQLFNIDNKKFLSWTPNHHIRMILRNPMADNMAAKNSALP